MNAEAQRETLEFQAEVRQILDLMIHSLYSNREIFLRELISNASDAADRLRFEALQHEALWEQDPDPAIRLSVDADAGTLTVSDNGIGMTRDEVVEHLGTIARSGTRQFLEALSADQAGAAQLIGQFGVGFYSAFIVAERVEVHTRRAGLAADQGVRWESDGQGRFSVEYQERAARGTDVTLHLREDAREFLEPSRIKALVRRYSDHISLPIRMAGEDEGEEETVNQASALWMRPKSDISDEEYREFYRHVAHDPGEPLTWVHNKVEGNQSYTALLFVPGSRPFDLFEREQHHGVRLYVRRVFIMEDPEHLMPRYLRFVRGVVDSDDLPLNVSRELLQHNKLIDRIRTASVRRILDQLEKLARDEPERYVTFWKEFGTVLKEGIVEDREHQQAIARLLRFSSTRDDSPEATVSLDDYLARMPESQKAIYYVTADSFNAARNSPHLEVFRKHGVEVLLLHEPVDEWLAQYLTEYQNKPLRSVAKGDFKPEELEGETEKSGSDDAYPVPEAVRDLLGQIKEALGERVSDVRPSARLTESPACLVVGEYELGMHLERMLRAAGHEAPRSRPVLEVNPDHPLLARLRQEPDQLADWSALLFDQALLAEGGQLEDPAGFVRRMNALLLESPAHAGTEEAVKT